MKDKTEFLPHGYQTSCWSRKTGCQIHCWRALKEKKRGEKKLKCVQNSPSVVVGWCTHSSRRSDQAEKHQQEPPHLAHWITQICGGSEPRAATVQRKQLKKNKTLSSCTQAESQPLWESPLASKQLLANSQRWQQGWRWFIRSAHILLIIQTDFRPLLSHGW